jgi:hypothetical protein
MSWIDALRAEGDHATRIRTDLEYFSQHLKIRPKIGPLAPLVFNPAQLELHRRIEEQRAKTGRVRVVILKARQLGISTYIAARLYHRTINTQGSRCLIVGHEKRASSNLSVGQAVPRSLAR